jgi:hypothetical protein
MSYALFQRVRHCKQSRFPSKVNKFNRFLDPLLRLEPLFREKHNGKRCLEALDTSFPLKTLQPVQSSSNRDGPIAGPQDLFNAFTTITITLLHLIRKQPYHNE